MIEFKPVDRNNFNSCINLKSGLDESYLAPVSVQIAMSYVYPQKVPLAIYQNDVLIGFVSYEKDTVPRVAYDILVFIIDQKLQGMGFGTKALRAFVRYLFAFKDCDVITLNYNPENKRAQRLYKKIGFRDTGSIYNKNGERIMELQRGSYSE